MLQLDNPERLHIGRQLAAHRTALGVSAEAMASVDKGHSLMEIGWTEGADMPSVLRIRRWHWIMIEAYEALAHPADASVPFREQWFTTRHDQLLHRHVMAAGRRSAWWWGAARTPRGAGAFCYYCNTLIHAYDLGRGVTHPVRLSVMNHRAEHVAALLHVTTTPHGRKRT
jgi:hypothetical protein